MEAAPTSPPDDRATNALLRWHGFAALACVLRASSTHEFACSNSRRAKVTASVVT